MESIIDVRTSVKRPWGVFFTSFFYAMIGAILAYSVMPSDVSLSMVFFSAMAGIPLLVKLLQKEERKEVVFGKPIIKTHTDVLSIMFFMFFGMLAFYTSFAVILPEDSFRWFFDRQIDVINNVSGAATSERVLEMILANNLKVLAFVTIFSFIYGAGAIFILNWNASVLGAALGNVIREEMSRIGIEQAIPLALGRYMVHGTLEMIAYFLGAIAGGIISAAVVRHDYRSSKFKEVVLDSLDTLVLASITLIIAAVLEVYL